MLDYALRLAERPHSARVRLSLSGKELVGDLRFPGDTRRLSDVLNEETKPFLPLFNAENGSGPAAPESQTVVLTDAISWVEARAEPQNQSDQRDGGFHAVVIELSDPAVTVRGDLFVRADSSVYEALADGRRFICLCNARFGDSEQTTPFLAVATRQARVISYTPKRP